MTDIVDRLNDSLSAGYSELRKEAAREILQLRKERDALRAENVGSQPTPSLPEGWKPMPKTHPTFDLVDLRLADGSVICGCIQIDGDYWWIKPYGETFIDERYAPVTHWRLAAAPESRP